MKELNYQEIEILNEKTKSRIMKEYYSIKEDICKTSLNKIKNFNLVKEISALLNNNDDKELLQAKKMVLGYCLEDIKTEKKLINRLEEIENSNLFKEKETKEVEETKEFESIIEVKNQINNITKYVLTLKDSNL